MRLYRTVLLVASSVLLARCSAGVRPLSLTPEQAAAGDAERPAGVPPAASLLAACVGVQPAGHALHLACADNQQIYAARYDAEAEPASCRRIVGEEAAPGPALPLPPGSLTYRTASEVGGPAGPSGVAACVPVAYGGLMLVGVHGLTETDTAFAAQAIPAVVYDGVPYELLVSNRPDSLDFLGRTLLVHPSCRLMGPQNLSCYPAGQMNWAAFATTGDARAVQSRQIQSSIEQGATVLEDEAVACTFEGVRAECRRIVYRLPVSRILTLGATNVLVAYYVTAEVRGRNAQAVCSFYTDQGPEDGLAALCAEAFRVGS